jgi:malate permease and related proteins
MYLDALFKVVPVILLLLLGYLLGRYNFLSLATLSDLKKLVVNITLPAALFLAFARVSLEPRLLIIPLVIFSACLLVFLASRRFAPNTWTGGRYFPYLMTGFEAGMLGYAIFGAVYGQDNIYKFGLVDLGQVTFVFFILVPSLQQQASGPQRFTDTLGSFFRTPVILAILVGVLFNQSGLYERVSGQAWYGSLETTLQLLGGMTTPLVALIIGSELRLQPAGLSQPVRTVLVRLLIWAPAGLAFGLLVAGPLLGLDGVYQAAVVTMAILPPPFVIPLFMKNTGEGETAYVVNTLSLSTLVALGAFILISFLFPP